MSTAALETLCKWRNVYGLMATMGSQESFERYVRDTADKHLLLRAEVNAMTALLIQKGVFTATEFAVQLDVEAEHLSGVMVEAFPGFEATEIGLTMKMPEVQETMQSWQRPNGMGR